MPGLASFDIPFQPFFKKKFPLAYQVAKCKKASPSNQLYLHACTQREKKEQYIHLSREQKEESHDISEKWRNKT